MEGVEKFVSLYLSVFSDFSVKKKSLSCLNLPLLLAVNTGVGLRLPEVMHDVLIGR